MSLTLKDLYAQLSYGELKNLSLAGSGSGDILAKDRPSIILFANEGLLDLYTRFILNEKDVAIELVEHITFYYLKKEFAESQRDNSSQDFLYIKDLDREPFEEDAIRILEVFNGANNKLPLNDSENPFSLFTPKPLLLQVPRPVTGRPLGVVYQAKPEKLVLDDEPENQFIKLPDHLVVALRSYIAYKVYSGMNTAESVSRAQEHIGLYEAVCEKVIDRDLVGSSISTTNTNFHRGGWI